ncbi:hypothetical protein [Leifsonia sp. Leaf264]|uniref:hypothetical protein n=1 Tax=Leifsonia sp. Leaf264 TaxID=1736314 RepID=UPI0006F78457|nr:hypothetical protein [Leifsonia sp. Leaf264]KQO98785.1 hypothetical protein ASF30_12035 [Leifsonia sp. Leaf264]
MTLTDEQVVSAILDVFMDADSDQDAVLMAALDTHFSLGSLAQFVADDLTSYDDLDIIDRDEFATLVWRKVVAESVDADEAPFRELSEDDEQI